jgi:hypothetical protein
MLVMLGVMTGLTSTASPSIHCCVAFLQQQQQQWKWQRPGKVR